MSSPCLVWPSGEEEPAATEEGGLILGVTVTTCLEGSQEIGGAKYQSGPPIGGGQGLVQKFGGPVACPPPCRFHDPRHRCGLGQEPVAPGGGFTHRVGTEIESALLNDAVCFRAQAAYSTDVGGNSVRKGGVHEIRRPEGDGRWAPAAALFGFEGESVLSFGNPDAWTRRMELPGGRIHPEQVGFSLQGQNEAGVGTVHGHTGCCERRAQGALVTRPPDPEDRPDGAGIPGTSPSMPPLQGYQGQPKGVRVALDVQGRRLIQSDRSGVGQRSEGGLEVPGHPLREVLVFRVERHGSGGSHDPGEEGLEEGGGVELLTVPSALLPEKGQRVPGQWRLRGATGRVGSGAGGIVISGHGRLVLWRWECGGAVGTGLSNCAPGRQGDKSGTSGSKRGMHGKMVTGACEEKGK